MWSSLTFSFLTPLFEVAKQRTLKIDDAPTIPDRCDCGNQFSQQFYEEFRDKGNVLQALFIVYGCEYIML